MFRSCNDDKKELPWIDMNYDDLEKEVKKGNEKAKTKLAWLLLSGIGVEKDVDRAVAILEERIRVWDADALWILGICYECGIGVEKDFEKSRGYFKVSRMKTTLGWYFSMHRKHQRKGGEIIIGGLLKNRRVFFLWLLFWFLI